jgi:hypothetical protein
MPVEPALAAEPAPVPCGTGRLGAGETAVVISAITAVTVLAVLQRPVPVALTVLASVACLLLVPGRTGRVLTALTTGDRG